MLSIVCFYTSCYKSFIGFLNFLNINQYCCTGVLDFDFTVIYSESYSMSIFNFRIKIALLTTLLSIIYLFNGLRKYQIRVTFGWVENQNKLTSTCATYLVLVIRLNQKFVIIRQISVL